MHNIIETDFGADQVRVRMAGVSLLCPRRLRFETFDPGPHSGGIEPESPFAVLMVSMAGAQSVKAKLCSLRSALTAFRAVHRSLR